MPIEKLSIYLCLLFLYSNVYLKLVFEDIVEKHCIFTCCQCLQLYVIIILLLLTIFCVVILKYKKKKNDWKKKKVCFPTVLFMSHVFLFDFFFPFLLFNYFLCFKFISFLIFWKKKKKKKAKYKRQILILYNPRLVTKFCSESSSFTNLYPSVHYFVIDR